MLHHLAPTGTMATVLANGSLSSKTSGEGEIRKNLIEADLVECIVAMPDKLFYTTGIPVAIWFLTKDWSVSRFLDKFGVDFFGFQAAIGVA